MLADTIINRQCEITAETELFKDLKKRGDPYVIEGDRAAAILAQNVFLTVRI